MASEVTVDPFSMPSESPPQPQHKHKKTWAELRQAVRNTRKVLTSLASRVPSSFTFRRLQTEHGPVTRIYFLGLTGGSRENTLLYVDIPLKDNSSDLLMWKNVLDSFQATLSQGELSKEEQLMRERQRLGTLGITSYDLDNETGTCVFPACSSLFCCELPEIMSEEKALPTSIPTLCTGARLDPKICPTNTDLLGFINNGDLWVTNVRSGAELRLTFSQTVSPREKITLCQTKEPVCKSDINLVVGVHAVGTLTGKPPVEPRSLARPLFHRGLAGAASLSEDPKSSGVPSFVVQEEFDRYTGYWWQPVKTADDGPDVYRVLYEEMDESDVEILHIYSPSADGVDEFRYPRAGTDNAKCCLKIVEFESTGGQLGNVLEKQLYEPLSTFLPWTEYIVRAGWTPDAKYVWAQVLSRSQCQLAVVLIPPDCFIPTPVDMEVGSFDSSVFPPLQVIYEDTSDIWVNVHDLLYFFPQQNDAEISFIWGSEKSGFRHLYLVTSSLRLQASSSNTSEPMERCEGGLLVMPWREAQLTSGDWEVNPKQIWVDERRQLVYFLGLKDSPLETHFYVVSYTHPSEAVRLTRLGYSHSISCDKDCSMFVTVYSSIREVPCSKVFRIIHGQDGDVSPLLMGTLLGTSFLDEEYRSPELVEYQTEAGHRAYGMVYKPGDYEHGVKYPTVLFVYGGPQVQLVTNAFKGLKFLRLHTLALEGYVVVVIDGRGSSCRGLQFESHLKNKLGCVELEDQVEGLTQIAAQLHCIDLSRVAIHGWSYGGYLALMGLAQRPEVFKVAIAGAPVVMWTMYDTGYTERYMGVPATNGHCYEKGSVLHYVDKFPDEENRLLIIHGLIDENVHFQHTSVLVNSLIKLCKPYQLQVYPSERHGIRNHESSEHYKTMVLSFLQHNL